MVLSFTPVGGKDNTNSDGDILIVIATETEKSLSRLEHPWHDLPRSGCSDCRRHSFRVAVCITSCHGLVNVTRLGTGTQPACPNRQVMDSEIRPLGIPSFDH
eukprot:3704333-Rhodomonas_salina.1